MIKNLLKFQQIGQYKRFSICYLSILSYLPRNMLRLLTYYIYFLNGQVIFYITLIIFFHIRCFLWATLYQGKIENFSAENCHYIKKKSW